MKHVIIIGGGIAGLSAAYWLKKSGVQVTLLERSTVVGGAIKTVLKRDSYLLELGPNTFLSSSEAIFELSRELEIQRKLISNPEAAKKRYLYRNSSLHELPAGLGKFMRSRTLSFKGKMRVMLEPMIKSRSEGSESLAAFVKRRGGKEILETLVDPFVSGVYAGDPYQLEIKSVFPRLVEIERECGSIFKGMRHLKGKLGGNDLLSYYWGMQTLPARIHDILDRSVRIGTNADEIVRIKNGRWSVSLGTSGEIFEGDAVIIASQAGEAARLLVNHVREIFEPLMNIPYVPLAVVHTAYKRTDIPFNLDGFGFLVPRREKVRLLGSIWSSSLFPNRAPHGEVLLTNFIGGATDPDAIDLDDNQLLSHVCLGVEQAMGVTAEPCFAHITRISQAIPQYTIGHSMRLEKIERCLKRLPGIFLAGSYFTGISVADTLAHSKDVAISVNDFLNRTA